MEPGVDREDVQTTGLDIHAAYDYSGEGATVITGYAVSQRMSVMVRSLPDSGDAISAAAAAGGNAIRLHGVKLRVGDEFGLLRKARDAAIADARAKAEQYAAYDRVAALSAVPIRAGSADLSVSVSVVWALEPAAQE